VTADLVTPFTILSLTYLPRSADMACHEELLWSDSIDDDPHSIERYKLVSCND